MEFINNFYLFLSSVLLISLSGVLMPGPLFAVTIKRATKSKGAGVLIAIGHGLVELPLMFLILLVLSQVSIPNSVQTAVGLIGGLFMIFMGIQAFRNRNKEEQTTAVLKRDSIIAGAYTTAANAGFILWWLTIGTTLILNAKLFGIVGFTVFAGVHWLTDFAWYAAVAFLIFKSQRFWTKRTHSVITLFCVAVFVGFGLYFLSSAIWSLFA